MKKKRIGFQVVVGMCAALGWWGFLYPELVLTPETVTVLEKEEKSGPAAPSEDRDFGGSLYRELLNAGRDRITFRSRLLTNLNSFWEAFHGREADK